MESKRNHCYREMITLFLLLPVFSGCVVRNGSSFSDLYPMFNILWMSFLFLGVATGIYYIFGKDESKRKNSGRAAIVCIILFVGLLITA